MFAVFENVFLVSLRKFLYAIAKDTFLKRTKAMHQYPSFVKELCGIKDTFYPF